MAQGVGGSTAETSTPRAASPDFFCSDNFSWGREEVGATEGHSSPKFCSPVRAARKLSDTLTHARTHARTHIHTHTHTNTHTRTHTYTHTYTHTRCQRMEAELR
jgi:hypothetical protein